MAFLLDTNIVSDLVRNPRGQVRAHIAAAGENSVFTSILVAAEVRYGAARRQSTRLAEQVEIVLAKLKVLDFKSPAERTYAIHRASLEAAGTPIGGNDMFIAAHALTLGFTLVTDNVREFTRIKQLRVENWLR